MIEPAKIQVRYADLDTMGHVNNSVYFTYFEYTRVYYFNQLLSEEWKWDTDGVLVASNEISYLKPVLLNEIPEIELFLVKIGTKSFTLAYELRVNGELRTIGKSTLVGFNSKTNKSIAINNTWKNALHQLNEFPKNLGSIKN